MKTVKYISILVLLVCACLTLVACGKPCEHDFQPDRFVVEPTCGELTEGVRLYVCSLCGESEERPVTNTQAQHSMESEITTPATCTQAGERTFTCTYCGYCRTSSIPHAGGHLLDTAASVVDYEANTRTTPCTRCGEQVVNKAYVTYAEFGAKGDGVTDDMPAIIKTHAYANKNGVEVWADAGATYYIGYSESSAIVQTNVNWRDATFYIDDTVVPWYSAGHTVNIFVLAPDTAPTSVSFASDMTLTKGQTNIGLTFDAPCMLHIQNDNERIYLRVGNNENNEGSPKNEMILVDENGNVDPSTPIQYEYAAVTSITRYSIADAPITIRGGVLKTVTCDPHEYDPDYVNRYCYFGRGVRIERSNATIDGVVYKVEGEHVTGDDATARGVPYRGSFSFGYCYNVTLQNATLDPHREYVIMQPERNQMGSYTLDAWYTIGLKFINLTQTGDITNRADYHGIMGTNFCRNIYVEGCYLDRFDSHQGVYNATIKDAVLGFDLYVIGGGTLYMERVERLAGTNFVGLRGDYNSIFDGDIYFIDCIVGASIEALLQGNWNNKYSGIPNYIGRNVYIDGLTLARKSKVVVYDIAGASLTSIGSKENQLILPKKVTISGVKGGTLTLARQSVFNQYVKVED